MSTPKNHHYVSRVLSNNFLSLEGRIYRYSKVNRRISALHSTKGLFSKQHLNTTIDDEGNVDHLSVERSISNHFEKDFPRHYKVIMDMLAQGHEIGKTIPNSETIIDAVKRIIEMGFIGKARHPLDMYNSQNAIFNAMMNLANGLGGDLRKSMLAHFINKANASNKIPLDYPALSNRMAELMGATTYSIMLAPNEHYFLLPDCTATTKRFKMKDNFGEEEVFINPGMVVGLVIMPINSKVILTATQTEFSPDHGNGTYILSEKLTRDYNKALFESSIFEVACENRAYLEQFIGVTYLK